MPLAVRLPAVPQQAAQPQWQEEYYWEGEEGYVEEGGEEYVETPADSYNYEGLGEQAENGVISTGNADIVFNNDTGGDAGDTGYQEPVVQPAIDYPSPVQDNNEGEAFVF